MEVKAGSNQQGLSGFNSAAPSGPSAERFPFPSPAALSHQGIRPVAFLFL